MMLSDGMFIALRAEAQETVSLLKQVLDEQKRTNELLGKMVAPLPIFEMPADFELTSADMRAVQVGESKVERVGAKPKAPPRPKGKLMGVAG